MSDRASGIFYMFFNYFCHNTLLLDEIYSMNSFVIGHWKYLKNPIRSFQNHIIYMCILYPLFLKSKHKHNFFTFILEKYKLDWSSMK